MLVELGVIFASPKKNVSKNVQVKNEKGMKWNSKKRPSSKS